MKFFLAIKRPENIDDIPEWQPNERRRDALVLKLGL